MPSRHFKVIECLCEEACRPSEAWGGAAPPGLAFPKCDARAPASHVRGRSAFRVCESFWCPCLVGMNRNRSFLITKWIE